MNAHRRPLVYGLVGVLVALFLLLALGRIAQTASLAKQIRQSQVTNSKTLNNSHAVLRVIQDCTRPGGACYTRSKRATAHAVANINNVVILAAACSAGLPPGLPVPARQARIQTCVIHRLARH